MKKVVWKNKSNEQLCVTIPKNSGIIEGDVVSIGKHKVNRIVYSHSSVDLFHYGHIRFLEAANKLGEFNVCGVLTNDAIKSYKKEPVADLKERMALVSSLRCVDMVMTQDNLNPTENLKKIHAQFPGAKIILAHGSDWENIPGEEFVKSVGGQVIKPEFYDKLSTQNIVKKIFRIYQDE